VVLIADWSIISCDLYREMLLYTNHIFHHIQLDYTVYMALHF